MRLGPKPPQRPEEISQALVASLREVLGADLLGVCLYGSAAVGRYRKGASDLNLLLLVTPEGAARPADLIPWAAKWAKARVASPLLVTREYLLASRDVFPIELLVMAAEHKCLWGENPLEGLAVDPRHLRLQLERELKGKLMALRTRLMASQGRRPELMEIVRQALPAFNALFKACLQLITGGFPLRPAEVLQTMEQRGMAVKAISRLQAVKEGRERPKTPELVALLQEACREIDTLSQAVDQFPA